MSNTAVARRASEKIARPLKVLIPLIQQDLERGDRAGMEYYADAGDKLIEAKEQVSFGYWGAWISKNFDRSDRQAREYMRLARLRAERAAEYQNGVARAEVPNTVPRSMSEARGATTRARERRAAEQPLRAVLQDVDTDLYAQEKQTRDDEIRLHRELAVELVDAGYKALATRLHPDRGGSKDAMARLNRVRAELKGFAETRRFV